MLINLLHPDLLNASAFMAIVIAGIVNLALGFLWYSPYMFQQRWLHAMGRTGDPITIQPIQYFINLIFSFGSALVLAIFLVNFTNVTNGFQFDGMLDALIISLLFWAGFVVTTNYGSVIFEKIPNEAYIIYIAYQLVAFILMGFVIEIILQLV